ncbi:MAG: hypothetical protein WCH40_12430, partial [Verrucomicrobiales bacterium]
TLPYYDKSRLAWIPLTDKKGQLIARYAFWVEDLQSRVDARTAGNIKDAGAHNRYGWKLADTSNYPKFPAPGLNPAPSSLDKQGRDREPPLDQVALYILDPASTAKDTSSLDNSMIALRTNPNVVPFLDSLLTPDSTLAFAGLKPPLTRDATGRLVDPKARSIEENLTASLQPYDELAVVPFASGLDMSVAGKTKLNLNKLLTKPADTAVDEMSSWIKSGLPQFDTRKGGFPDDYVKTLSANAIDYADKDTTPTLKAGAYRGIEAYPLVSEFLMRMRWEDIKTENGRKYAYISFSIYVELWNMTDQEIAPAQGEVSYETKIKGGVGVNSFDFGDPAVIRNPSIVTASPSALSESAGVFWAPFTLATPLKPNEYRVVKVTQVNYKIDGGRATDTIASPVFLDGDDGNGSGVVSYKMKWDGKLIDQARGLLRRNLASINYPSGARQKTRANVPSLSHKRGTSFIDGPGDPRISFYNLSPQDANAYPGNYSPNRRNIRWDSIYKGDQTKIYGRVLPAEWPDGGHNSEYGSNTFATTDESVSPDDPRFFMGLPIPKAEEAPQRLSNRGRFFSATELGRVYDPVMWNAGVPSGTGTSWPDVGLGATSSGDYGGGNSLRIGRYEHPRFDVAGQRASQLLDLFHAGKARSETAAEREGDLVR